MVLAVPDDAEDLPPALAAKTSRGAAVAYVCKGSTCSVPIDSLSGLINKLRAGI
jgi:uncharacterized protein YyaL (SSP411 family)